MTEETKRPTSRAQALRTNATGSERLLWKRLRGSALDGFKFSRQIPIGPFICGCVCRSQRLVIELDGDSRAVSEKSDEARTRYIEAQGYRVIRFFNNQVTQNVEWVVGEIRASLPAQPGHWGRPIGRGSADMPRRASATSPTPSPSPTGRGAQ